MNDLICISHLRWDFVWQRPQHVLSRLAAHHRILFVEEPISSTEATQPRLEVTRRSLPNGAELSVVQLIQPVEQERWIGHGDPLTQGMYSALLKAYLKVNGYEQPILWLYTPMALDFSLSIDYGLLVVDVMDQLSAFKGAPRELAQNEAMLLPVADVIFTGGMSLYRDKKLFNPNCYCFPSGVETEHFARAAKRDAFPKPKELEEISAPIIGYYGVIDERMDLELIRKMAEQHPEWNIVLIGPVVKIDAADLPQAPNLHYIGMKSYAELPAYLAHVDAAIVPFALNDSTRYLSPTKTLEYMAARKPIISTAIYDVGELYGSAVDIGKTHEDFIALVETALTAYPLHRRAEENKLLAQNTWDSIATRMMNLLRSRQTQIQRRIRTGEKARVTKVG